MRLHGPAFAGLFKGGGWVVRKRHIVIYAANIKIGMMLSRNLLWGLFKDIITVIYYEAYADVGDPGFLDNGDDIFSLTFDHAKL